MYKFETFYLCQNIQYYCMSCIYLFSMVATLNFNCDNILVASYIKFVIIEFDNFDIVLKRM